MFTSRDTRKLIRCLPPSYSAKALAADIAQAVYIGEGQGNKFEAAMCISRISRRFKKHQVLRNLWNSYTQLAELYALKKKWVGDPVTGARYTYASPAALAQYGRREQKRIIFESGHMIVLPAGVSADGTRHSGFELPLSNICRTSKKQFAELYAVTKGIEKYAKSQNWESYFWTFTTPSRYHPNPSNGNCTYNSATPLNAHEWINERFIKVRALFSKHNLPLLGTRVVEMHKDGCPHWHIALFYPENLKEEIKACIEMHLPSAKCVESDPSKGSAATYLFKYLQKGTDSSPSAIATRAQLTTWGIRQFSFYGSLSLSLWR